MTPGLQLRVGGTCAKCLRERELVMVGTAGICASCIERHIGTSPGPAPSSLDACTTCGMSYGCGTCGVTPAPAHAKRWVLHVERLPPSQNEIRGTTFPPRDASAKQLRGMMLASAGRYGRLVEEWRAALRDACMAAAVWKATGRRRLVFTRLLGSRNHYLDHFNLCGGLKPVVDALVHLEALVDDDIVHLDAHANQRRVQPGELAGLRIEITELTTEGDRAC